MAALTSTTNSAPAGVMRNEPEGRRCSIHHLMKSRPHSPAAKALLALGSAGFGAVLSFYSLIVLGAGRHGRTDVAFLHLDWIFQPDLPYWGAHMFNLAQLLVGVLILGTSAFVLLRWSFLGWRAYRQAAPE